MKKTFPLYLIPNYYAEMKGTVMILIGAEDFYTGFTDLFSKRENQFGMKFFILTVPILFLLRLPRKRKRRPSVCLKKKVLKPEKR